MVCSDLQLEQLNALVSLTKENYPVGAVFPSPQALLANLRDFASKKGFAVARSGQAITCSRASLSELRQRQQLKKKLKTPAEKQRAAPNSTRCGCKFKVNWAFVDRKNMHTDTRVRITDSTNYNHSNGCFPCRSQLAVEKRKAGHHTVSLHEGQIKTILAVMKTEEKIPIGMLRELLRPLYPPGTSLDCKLMFNFRLKAKRMLAAGLGDLATETITEQQEQELLAPLDLESQCPAFMTEVYSQFRELLQEAMLDRNDTHQILDRKSVV